MWRWNPTEQHCCCNWSLFLWKTTQHSPQAHTATTRTLYLGLFFFPQSLGNILLYFFIFLTHFFVSLSFWLALSEIDWKQWGASFFIFFSLSLFLIFFFFLRPLDSHSFYFIFYFCFNDTVWKEWSAPWRSPLALWDYCRRRRFVVDKSTLGIMSSSGKSILARTWSARTISTVETRDRWTIVACVWWNRLQKVAT